MKKLKIVIAIIFLGLTAVIIWLSLASGEYYKTYSPDKQYSVYAKKYNWEGFIPRMPGGSGDASGKVFLYDEIEQKIINKAEISMISITSDIKWDRDDAYFISDGYPSALKPWKLPRSIEF